MDSTNAPARFIDIYPTTDGSRPVERIANAVVRAHADQPGNDTLALARYVEGVGPRVEDLRSAYNVAKDSDAGFALLIVRMPGPVLEAVLALLIVELPLRGGQ